ncbi:Venom carboxylesterase-6 [Papilio machaon]|uniref:Venom carboxylesterase-6 n=1 Tax=Papilio machaon TaxID=76193 RepID=A0A194QYN7_PAPMA|nr:Venom carboxylesterase-6 [Papilio machaon]
MKFLWLLCALCVANYVDSANFRVDPLVLIEQGLVRGRKSKDNVYSAFLGIPYAQVDSSNPFGPAVPPAAFEEEIFDADDGTVKCPQSLTASARGSKREIGQLDCLYLNIYVPIAAGMFNPLPVLVWIHGGQYTSGSGGEYDAHDLVKQGIIVVTINYRLGPYGFMCLDDPSITGNQGLKDQYTALRWIRRNIGAFGGNPYNVTIGGQNAGATSVLLHLYSDNEKLFNKAIVESGTPQSEGMFVNGDLDAAIKLAAHLGLNTTSNAEALTFLTSSSPHIVTAAATDINLKLGPCKEKSFSSVENFVETDPFTLSNERKIRNTPVLIGHTSKEKKGSVEMHGNEYFKTDPFYEKLRDNFNLNEEQLAQAAGIVRRFYIGDKPISSDVTAELEDFESDFIHNHPTQRTITNLLNENAKPVYNYEFSYGFSGEDAPHSAEIAYLFPDSNANDEAAEEDRLISNRITTLWANFVKYGNPTPQTTDLIPVTWESVSEETRPYLVIDTDLRLEHRIFNSRMAFWDLFYSIYGKLNKLARECDI